MIIKKDSWHYRLMDLFVGVPWELKHQKSALRLRSKNNAL
jgi:hypothetical protein